MLLAGDNALTVAAAKVLGPLAGSASWRNSRYHQVINES
jgi:hypothetical protein